MYRIPPKLKAIDSIKPCYLFDVLKERNKPQICKIPIFVEQFDLIKIKEATNTRKLSIYAHSVQYRVTLNLTQAFPR